MSNTAPRALSAALTTLASLALIGCVATQPTTTASASGASGTAFFEQGGERCIRTDNVPEHSVGQFPTRGNPNTLRAQTQTLCVPLNPSKGRERTTEGSVGIALNGVQFRPSTAEYYDPSGRQNRSRDPSSGWRLDGMGAADALGMDQNDAHVDDRGLYHYHGVSAALRGVVQGTLLGYAADGFEIHYDGRQRSSYRLKSGTRPSGPGGRHDGTYEQDWEYVAGSGTLDACNGGTKDGRFVYYATTTYPFFPRCLYGSISGDFR